MKYSIATLFLSILSIAADKHFDLTTTECSLAYQDHNGLVWSLTKETHEEPDTNNINVFHTKTGRPVRVFKHTKINGKLQVKVHCQQDSVELISRLDQHVNVCRGEEGHHEKCKCEELAPGRSITHRGEDSIRINDRHNDECAGKGLFPLA
ncbi:hypothetical protein CONCODRAFT_12914 [Conidiobolus coronatus NRRL 28638]|uniref:Cyanovirin-N domain-containing protein n=1 Tax=Conidiobolus coronatus (strain ATCC 28846 / CBS 209.66 / NRRL 28638) TaxID=796925 RepID=A0A137NRV9_CONC2|nr:hypothetical protein CONCODRAFT_12914 [Conidiobolus coronatus NRRL 28638]|eukprot:KXN65478.1 hypothetical protein CONCODRAFT_12914 [Conidiobolus coronatus NRRL 28638]